MDREIVKDFYIRLYDILASRPEGMAEFELLELLRGEEIPLFVENDRHDPLEIFQRHFLLFHLLYGLRDTLHKEQRGDISIHCLKIILQPQLPDAESSLPAEHDPLRDYYLDLGQLKDLERSDVEAMLDRFWQMYSCYENRDAALAVLGLEGNENREEVTQRYRQLVRKHHPDRGGDPERFRQVKEAAEQLLGA